MKIDEKDTAIKSYFLGPQSENAEWAQKEISRIFSHWFEWRKSLFPEDGTPISLTETKDKWFLDSRERLSKTLSNLISMYQRETPKFTPRYIGHMVSEVTLPSIFGHILNLLHNPNLASKEVSKVGSIMEKEAITALSEMVGYSANIGVGHFTSGGTLANFEALWRARYRLDHWLALGTYLKAAGLSDMSLFESAHRGWDDYDTTVSKFEIDEESLKQYSFVASCPWTASDEYEKTFGKKFKGPVILVPGNKHYSWQKGLSLLGLGDSSFWSIELNFDGKLCCKDLVCKIEKAKEEGRPILMVVSVSGTTEMGVIDPVNTVQDILDSYKAKHNTHIWHHVDGAYGGFFCSLLGDTIKESLLDRTVIDSLDSIKRAESVTIDPHKLGYVPYACGAILLKDERCNRVSSFEAPYLLKQKDNKAWSTTLEGSRSSSGAAATWMNHKSIGFNPDGFGAILHKGILAKKTIAEKLSKLDGCYIVDPCDTNVLCFCFAKEGEKTSVTNKRNFEIFESFMESKNFSVSKTRLNVSSYRNLILKFGKGWSAEIDSHDLYLIRLVLMNPFVITTQTNKKYIDEFIEEIELITRQH
ncbi:pyridoxal-dependent decarboxylase [bacterium]|nr:pyridoxal-dependent decarboxylase [bacterium]